LSPTNRRHNSMMVYTDTQLVVSSNVRQPIM